MIILLNLLLKLELKYDSQLMYGVVFILGDRITGPYFYSGTLTGHRYFDFIQNDFNSANIVFNAPLYNEMEVKTVEDSTFYV